MVPLFKALLPAVLLLASAGTFSAEVKYRSCLLRMVDTFNRWETKSDDKLNVVEFHFPGSASSYFQGRELTMTPVPFAEEVIKIYRRGPIARGAQKLFRESRLIEDVPNSSLPSLLKPNVKYTYVVQDNKVVFAQAAPGIVRDTMSKHAILRDQRGPLRLSGEFWVDDGGKFHIDGSSGTYTPKDSDVDNGVAFFRDHLGITNIAGHHFVPPPKPEFTNQSATSIAFKLYTQVSRPFTMTRTTYTIGNTIRLRQMEQMEGTVIEAEGPQGKESYQVLKTNSALVHELILDTAKLELAERGTEFRSTGTRPDKSSSAYLQVRERLPANASLRPQASEETSLTEFGLYPMKNGVVDLTRPSLFINLEKTTTMGIGPQLAGKSSVYYGAAMEGDPKLAKLIEKRFLLKEGESREQRAIQQLRGEVRQ